MGVVMSYPGQPQPIESTQARHKRKLIEYIQEKTKVLYSKDFDVISNKQGINTRVEDPVFSIKDLQILPKTRGLPILKVRFNLNVAINATLGAESDEQDSNARIAADKINALLETKDASMRLQITRVNRINDTASSIKRGQLTIILSQIEYDLLQRKGEYRL